jgi:hypothetical protein
LTLQRRQRRRERAFQARADGAWSKWRRSMRRACADFAVCRLECPRDHVAGGLPCHARQRSALAAWGEGATRAGAAGARVGGKPNRWVTAAGCSGLLPAGTRQRIDDMEQPFLICRARRRAASKRVAILVDFRHRVGLSASDCAQNRFPFRAMECGRAAWPDQAGNVMAFGMSVAIRSHSGETLKGRVARISCSFRNAPAQAWP